jgi:two-component system chemotaxis sensor kinase CheA
MDLARYAELFRTESREHLAEIDAALLALEQDGSATHVTVLFRSTHTIKGMAASMGYRQVELISHSLETLLDTARSGARALDDNVIALLFDGSDALAQAVDDAVDARPESNSAGVAALLQRLASAAALTPRSSPSTTAQFSANAPSVMTTTVANDHAATSSAYTSSASEPFAPIDIASDIFGGLSLPQELQVLELDENIRAPIAAVSTRVVDVRLSPDAALKGVRALMVLTRLEALGTVRSIEPAQHVWNYDAFDGALSITLDTAADDAKICDSVKSAGDVMRVSVRVPTTTRSERETLRHVRIDLRRLDTLLDLVGELVITRDRLLRTTDKQTCAPDAGRERALASVVHDTARLVTALQEEVLRTRMVPVGQVFDRFPRLVRDVARELGKDVAFVTEGRDIELDRSLLDAIGDPIVHLLRNAIDHGMELPQKRRDAGKAATGRLILRAARDRSAIVIQVQDDGDGINRDRVLARAKADGLVDADTTSLSDDGLLRVLSKAGFSTAKSVTSVSGRGVGIDVVTSRVRALGGTLELQSVQGRGTTFTLRLPVTLAVVRTLLVLVGGETYALPASHVFEAVEFDAASVKIVDGCETITVRDDVVPLMRLRERFGVRHADDYAGILHVVVVDAAGRETALLVDGLIGQQDVVVKPYDALRGAETLFTGATILGDGTPALIVDLGGLT